MRHSTRETRRYGEHKSQEGVVGQHTVGEESGKRAKGQEGERSYSRNFQHEPITLYPTQLNSLNTNKPTQPHPTRPKPSQAKPSQAKPSHNPTQPNPTVPLPTPPKGGCATQPNPTQLNPYRDRHILYRVRSLTTANITNPYKTHAYTANDTLPTSYSCCQKYKI